MQTSDARPPPGLVSIGYEGRSIDALVDELQAQQVVVLVDVRMNAVSRKPGFSKQALRRELDQAGIEYVHDPLLGNPRDNREGFRRGDPEARERYRDHMNSDGLMSLRRLAEQAAETRVALLCFEADHGACHRSIIAEEVQLRDPGISVTQA